MKTLTTKKINIFLAWNALKMMPPKAIDSINEMENISAIVKALAPLVSEFISLSEEMKSLRSKADATPEYAALEMELNKKATDLEEKQGEEIISVELEDAQFNTLFKQEESFGKHWFTEIDKYLEFRNDLVATNGQPKEKKSK